MGAAGACSRPGGWHVILEQLLDSLIVDSDRPAMRSHGSRTCPADPDPAQPVA
jgi:hypothetical protein